MLLQNVRQKGFRMNYRQIKRDLMRMERNLPPSPLVLTVTGTNGRTHTTTADGLIYTLEQQLNWMKYYLYHEPKTEEEDDKTRPIGWWNIGDDELLNILQQLPKRIPHRRGAERVAHIKVFTLVCYLLHGFCLIDGIAYHINGTEVECDSDEKYLELVEDFRYDKFCLVLRMKLWEQIRVNKQEQAEQSEEPTEIGQVEEIEILSEPNENSRISSFLELNLWQEPVSPLAGTVIN